MKDFFAQRKKLVLIFLVIAVLAGAFRVFGFVNVKTGTLIYCKYGELLEDKTRTVTVFRWLAGDYKVEKEERLCKIHEKSEQFYSNAQRAIISGRYDEALKDLEEVAKLDPDFQKTIEQIKGVQKALSKKTEAPPAAPPAMVPTPTTPVPTPTTPAVPTPTTPVPPAGTVEPEELISIDLAYVIPDTISGYYAGELVLKEDFVSRKFTATGLSLVDYMVISVYRFEKVSEAKNFVTTRAVILPDNQSNPKIGGRTAFFGTAGNYNAGLFWSNANYAFELSALSVQPEPQNVQDELIRVAQLLL